MKYLYNTESGNYCEHILILYKSGKQNTWLKNSNDVWFLAKDTSNPVIATAKELTRTEVAEFLFLEMI